MKHLNKILLLIGLLAVALSSCSNNETLDVEEATPFTITNMPYYNNIELGEEVEIRCTLASESSYEGLKYTIRYFPTNGKGKLQIGRQGEAMKPNDRYPIDKGDFRLYYTPTTDGQHTLELVLEDNYNQSQTLEIAISARTRKE